MSVVAIALSGGVDSSVAAKLLVEQGHQVVGIMLKLWTDVFCENENKCCTPESMEDAKRLAQRLGIPFYAIDARVRFKKVVVDYFLAAYEKGITPNPCLVCNRDIRWKFMMQEAENLGAEFLATGHYAQISANESGILRIKRGIDESKDQSYVLGFLSHEQLKKTMFPLGLYTKNEVRKLAREANISVAEKPDSQDLCFIGSQNYRSFLVRHIPSVVRPGNIVDVSGKQLGRHEGLAFYTIGQRKGLNVASPVPLYVIHKDLSTNTLIVGVDESTGRQVFIVEDLTWSDDSLVKAPFSCSVKTRYKSKFLEALVTPLAGGKAKVELTLAQRDITPGQGAVFYDADSVLGAGFISLQN